MNEEQDLKLTDLDYLTGDHHLQMMKAALPYMEVPEQKMLSVFVKIHELQRTVSLFRDEEVASMGICSLDNKRRSPLDMLTAIKPYGNTAEQDMIDLLCNFLQGGRMFHSPADTGENSGQDRRSVFEQMRGFLSPEQQSKLDTMQMMMQAMQQFT